MKLGGIMSFNIDFIRILQNFSIINNSIYIKKDEPFVSTISDDFTIYAKTKPHIFKFDRDFALYDLKKLIGSYMLFQTPPKVTLEEKSLILSDETKKIEIYYCNPELINYPKKNINLTNSICTFSLAKENFGQLQKMASVLGIETIQIKGNKNNQIVLTLLEPKNKTADNFSINITGERVDEDFTVFFNIQRLKFIPDDYIINITTKEIGLFESKNSNVEYYVQGGLN